MDQESKEMDLKIITVVSRSVAKARRDEWVATYEPLSVLGIIRNNANGVK